MRRLTRPESAQFEMSPEELQAMRDVSVAECERRTDGRLKPAAAFLRRSIPRSTSPHLGVTRRQLRRYDVHVHRRGDGSRDNTPTLVAPVIKADKAQAFIEHSIEAGMNWGSLQAEMGKLLADAKDVAEATKFVSGTGTNEAEGLIAGLAATSVITGAGTAAFAVADIYTIRNACRSRLEWTSQSRTTVSTAPSSGST